MPFIPGLVQVGVADTAVKDVDFDVERRGFAALDVEGESAEVALGVPYARAFVIAMTDTLART